MNDKKAYNQLDHSGTYRQDETSVTLTVLGGTYGGVRGTYSGRYKRNYSDILSGTRRMCGGGGKGILIQKERTGALSTLCNQYVCYDPSELKEERTKDENIRA